MGLMYIMLLSLLLDVEDGVATYLSDGILRFRN
jgi:hypothetical protein